MIVKTEATEDSEKGMSLGLGCQVMLREGLFRVEGMVGYNPQLGKRIQKPGLFWSWSFAVSVAELEIPTSCWKHWSQRHSIRPALGAAQAGDGEATGRMRWLP